jgi:hypothetical protein
MTTPNPRGGASVHARDRIPSTDLSSLLEFLVEAFPPQDPPADARSRPALSYDPASKRLILNTYGVLRRFLLSGTMRRKFAHSDHSGFLRDFGDMPRRLTIKMGGRLLDSDLSGVAQQVGALKRLVADELDRLDITSDRVLVSNPPAALAGLAAKMRLKGTPAREQAALVPMEFASPARSSAAREKDLARVISAREEIQGEDWLTRLGAGTAQAMVRRDDDFDEVRREILLETLRQDFEKPDSQITRFLNFLEDDALARVRLYVGFAIMEAVADQDSAAVAGPGRDLRDYVQRVSVLFNLYGAPEAEQALHINLSRDFGFDADFSLAEELVKARFYSCLPVWTEGNIQLFESRCADAGSGGVTVAREVNYRFRVNGRDPFTGKSAFDARLGRLRRTLLNDADSTVYNSFQRRRALAQVIFLWLVLNPDLHSDRMDEHAPYLTERLTTEGKAGVIALLADLDRWSGRVKKLSTTLVALLRGKAPSILTQAQRATRDLYLVVQQSVINWEAIGMRGGKVGEPLVKPDIGRSEQVEWFKYMKVARRPDGVPEPLFSVRIVTTLHERILVTRGNDAAVSTMRREIPDTLLNVVWLPIEADGASPGAPVPRIPLDSAWRMGAGVDIQYDPMQLTPTRAPGRDLNPHQYRTAGVAAFTVLVYVFLQVLVDRLVTAGGERIPVTSLRFQLHGRESSPTAGDMALGNMAVGDTAVYAAAQAMEAALMRDTPVRMQGMVCLPDDRARLYRETGTAYALFSAFPLVMGMPMPQADPPGPPALAKVALLVYSTRPCDEHPRYPHADGYIFRAKTYLADAVDESFSGYRLSFDRMQSRVVESRDEFESPTLIVEEVSRLHALGYDHIILLSSHFGNRRINKSAQRHSPHTRTSFLDEVATRFPNLMLYMLRRDVFPATRLHLRERGKESGFEALRLADHQEFAGDPADNLLKQLIPAYTFATLSIVGTDDAGRQQSGFCTYFLDTDYQVRNVAWREQARANMLGVNAEVRASLIAVLRGLHFLEAEQQPEGALRKAVLDPFGWVSPPTNAAAGEFQAVGGSRMSGSVLLSLPALLSHVSDALHSRGDR